MKEGDLEFLRALHEEKIRAQNERAELIGKKLTFIVVLFGVSSLDLGIKFEDLYWLVFADSILTPLFKETPIRF